MCCTNCSMNKQRKKNKYDMESMFQKEESNRIERDFDEGREKTIVIIKRGLIILVTLRQRKGINGDDDKRKSCINKFCIINKTNEFFGFCCCYFKL